MTKNKNENKSELERWSEIHEDAVLLEEFFQWLSENGYEIHKITEKKSKYWGSVQKLYPLTVHEKSKLIQKFYDIDAGKLEQERRELLKQVRGDIEIERQKSM